ncbi:hypothetical protein DN069_03545 [Streptacidiphilus pinicola]|uniref:DUF2180 domain-containing protein n=1 Tax=Streptacidiphilus pinicola TaxID=2219663 RepID=A0A2X0KK03_9ACTN|nr:DUF2180 family protein [Streptacidiphilus pinicola]RAG87040.1 hypothetical protein DN069_03545 [Streptacidiphilus pinicola]
MNCLDCDRKDMTAPALGICTNCGAGVCGAHLRVTEQALACRTREGETREVAPSARRILCPTCDQARHAYGRCCPDPTAARTG